MSKDTALDSHAVELIATMAIESATPEVHLIPTAGLGDGLPPEVPVGFDRKSQKFASVKALIEEQRLGPKQRAGTARAGTLDSFIGLVNRHKDDQSALFGKTNWPDPKLTAVLDYDSAGSPARWGKHRIEYAFPLTEEFKAWVDNDGKKMPQLDFATFLEDHCAELSAFDDDEKDTYEKMFREASASPSEVMQLSRELEVNVASRVKQGVRLSSGERVLEFSEEHQNAAGQKVVIPGIFMVSVRAFIDGEPVRIPARLRYRPAGTGIVWVYQLYRWEAFLREAVGRDLAYAAEKCALPAFDGAPEA